MSMAPIVGCPGTNGDTACVVLDSTVCAMRVPLKPNRPWQCRRRQHAPVFGGQELVPRHERARKLRILRRQRLLGIVQRIADEQLRAGGRHGVEAALKEVLIESLVEPESVLGEAAAERWSVGERELQQVGQDAMD